MIEDLFILKGHDEKDIVVQCCLCRKWKTEHAEYRQIDELLQKEIELNYLISHSYCNPCMEQCLREEGLYEE